MEEWDEIHDFDSPEHYRLFLQWIDKSIAEGALNPVPVEKTYASLMFDEKWYRARSGQIWRLVGPDFPFRGIFARVDMS